MRIGGMEKRYAENLCPSILEHMCAPHGVCNGLEDHGLDVPHSCNFWIFYLFFLSLSIFYLNLNLEFLQTPKGRFLNFWFCDRMWTPLWPSMLWDPCPWGGPLGVFTPWFFLSDFSSIFLQFSIISRPQIWCSPTSKLKNNQRMFFFHVGKE